MILNMKIVVLVLVVGMVVKLTILLKPVKPGKLDS